MNSYIYRLVKAKEYLENLPIEPETNALWDVLHQASWHHGIDWVMWVEFNNELVRKIIPYTCQGAIPNDVKREIRVSFREIKNIYR
jgi:hypothetical protein